MPEKEIPAEAPPTAKEQLAAAIGSLEVKSIFTSRQDAESAKKMFEKNAKRGTINLRSLSLWIQKLGFDGCEPEMVKERDTAIQDFRESIQPFQHLIIEHISDLPTYFEKQYNHWKEQCDDQPELAGHYTNNQPTPAVVDVRMRLGAMGILSEFDEQEYGQSFIWLRKTVKFLTETEAKNALKGPGKFPDEYDSCIDCLIVFLTKFCPNAGISTDDLDLTAEERKDLQGCIRQYWQRMYRTSEDSAQRIAAMTAKTNAALGILQEES